MLLIECFPERSSNSIAKQCGLSHPTIEAYRNQLVNLTSCEEPTKRVGDDGKSYSKPTKTAKPTDSEQLPTCEETDANDDAFRAKEEEHASAFNAGDDEEPDVKKPTRYAKMHAHNAILQLDKINRDDVELEAEEPSPARRSAQIREQGH